MTVVQPPGFGNSPPRYTCLILGHFIEYYPYMHGSCQFRHTASARSPVRVSFNSGPITSGNLFYLPGKVVYPSDGKWLILVILLNLLQTSYGYPY